MKALTNILTRLLMLLMIFIMACTEEAVEVNNLSRPGQYVSVRMNIPGMTATATRADDGVIESISALSFNSEGTRLGVNSVSNIKNLNADGGYNGTFNLSVPEGTSIIHFLANLPNGYDLTGVTKLSDLTTLTTDDVNLTYWGVAEYTGSSLFVDLYRNMAMIAITPAVVDTEFNQFEEGELFIAGLYNANQSGTLVPYKEAFNFNLNENDYYTLPTSLNKGNIKYDALAASTYAFEHANTRRDPLCAICKIGESFYKVALVDDRTGEPYDIIRNHKYIIYVSDVDDYQTDEYRAGSYEGALEKEPINLDVDEVKMVRFIYNEDASLNLNNNETFSVAVVVPDVKDVSLTAIYIEADDFDVTPESGLTGPNDDGVYTYIGGNTELTFTPKSAGSKSIVITGEAENMEVPRTEISVAVNATIVATSTPENPTLYYDSEDPQTVTIDVTIPKGVTALEIDADDFTVKQGEVSLTYDETKGVYTYSRGDATTQVDVDFVFTLKDDITTAKTSTITFRDASGNANVKDGEVKITVTAQTSDFMVTPAIGILNLSKNNQSITLTLRKPASLAEIKISGCSSFDIRPNIQGCGSWTNNGYLYFNNIDNKENIEFTLSKNNSTTTGTYTITFYGASNQNSSVIIDVIDIPEVEYEYYNKKLFLKDRYGVSNPTNLDVTVTIPNGSTLSELNILANGFIIKQGETMLSESGEYSYKGGTSTTFTFTPTSIGNKTISFSGKNDNLLVAHEISVRVGEQAPNEITLWNETGGYNIDNNGAVVLQELQNMNDLAQYYVVDNVIIVYYKNIKSEVTSKFEYLASSDYSPLSNVYEYTGTEERSCSLNLTKDVVNALKTKGGIRLRGTNVCVTRVSVIPAE